jgi:hypothetical protein
VKTQATGRAVLHLAPAQWINTRSRGMDPGLTIGIL